VLSDAAATPAMYRRSRWCPRRALRSPQNPVGGYDGITVGERVHRQTLTTILPRTSMTAAEHTPGPTARRAVLGAQLRRLREAAGISREDAGYAIRGSSSKISRLECGRVSFKSRDINDLLALYGVPEGERAPLIALAGQANANGWWHDYSEVLPSWFQTYVGLEEAAAVIRTYEIQFVPGLLQTAEYARAVVRSGFPDATAAEVEQRVALRLERQRVLSKPDPVALWVILDEATLSRPVGDASVMRSQVEHLLELTDMVNITIQVMPFRPGSHAADGGAFSILRFPQPDLPDIVYVEQLVGALYVDKQEHVERYLQTMDRLTMDSLSPSRTADALLDIVKNA
jgi:transcriptional regulator with XRE-family HTH domain